jgi:BMFP domain-containing protein YqiC
LRGKEDEARSFPHETLVRREEFDRSQERLRPTRDEWALQETPMGSLLIVRFD